MQSRETIERDVAYHSRVVYTNRIGAEYQQKPGRRKRICAEQASTLFELQVQIRAANKAIDRILSAAGYHPTKASRARVLLENWMDRGRVDVIHSAPKPKRP